MLEIEKAVTGLSPFAEAAEIIKETGTYQKEFTAQESVDIMSGFIMSIIKNRGATEALVSKMEIGIEKARGIIKGSVDVKKPAKVKINMTCALDNDTDQGKIKLSELDIVTEAGLRARIALKADNTVGKTRDDLKDPNVAFLKFIGTQFNPRGVTINELGLHFNESTLSVQLKGEPSAPTLRRI